VTPAFSVSVDGVDITGKVNDRLISLTVTDNEGTKSDSCEIRLDDRDGAISIPRKGAKMTIQMGYKQTGLQLMGQYTVDEVEVSGFPREMRISGAAADLRDKMKEHRNKGYEGKTLNDIVGEVAGRHGLSAAVGPSIGSFKYDHVAQSEESDLHFMTRLAKKHDAVAKVANGKLVFVKRGEGLAASGAALGAITIQGHEVLDYTGTFQDRPAFQKAKASWWDRKQAKRVTEESD